MTNEEALQEHARHLLARDREGLIAGYADDAVLLVGGNAIAGKEAIAAMFASVPDDALPTEVAFDSMLSHGDYLFATYHEGAMLGVDTFHYRDGKILMQSVHLVNAPEELAEHTPL